MTIAEAREKCKTLITRLGSLGGVPRDLLIFGVLISASLLSFGFGYRTGLDVQMTPIVIEERAAAPQQSEQGSIVASKSGVKYYYASCSGASRISDANKIFFTSAQEAQSAGYTLAVNCKEP